MWQIYSCPRCGITVRYGQNTCTNCGLIFYPGVMSVPPYGQYNPNQQQTWNDPSSYNQHSAGGNPNPYPQQYLYSPGNPMPEKKTSSGLVVSLIVFVVILSIAGAIVFIMNTNSSAKSISTAPSQSASPTSAPSITAAPPAVTSGSVTSPATVTENPATLPTVTSFTAIPTSISPGQSLTLQWNVSGATSASINGIGSVNSTSGTKTVTPTGNTVYTITATNSAGSIYASATVTVSPPTSSSGQSGDQSSAPWKTWGKSAGQSGTQSSADITPENWGKSGK
jgi:hypothetical protein